MPDKSQGDICQNVQMKEIISENLLCSRALFEDNNDGVALGGSER